jgi:hypothetical protein
VHGEDFFLKDDLPEVMMIAHTPACTKFYGTAMPRDLLLERALRLLLSELVLDHLSVLIFLGNSH